MKFSVAALAALPLLAEARQLTIKSVSAYANAESGKFVEASTISWNVVDGSDNFNCLAWEPTAGSYFSLPSQNLRCTPLNWYMSFVGGSVGDDGNGSLDISVLKTGESNGDLHFSVSVPVSCNGGANGFSTCTGKQDISGDLA